MATRRLVTSVAANTTSANILIGDEIQFVGRPTGLRVATTVPAAAAGVLLLTVRAQNRILVENYAVGAENAAGVGPVMRDNEAAAQAVVPGDVLSITFTNPTGGAIVVTTLVETTLLA